MNTARRFRQPWTTNECIRLQKEYDMNLSIDDIAQRHERTPNAIMYKLDREGIADYNELHKNYLLVQYSQGDYEESNDDSESESESDCDDSSNFSNDENSYNLHERVTELENRIEELMQIILSQNKKSGVFSSLFA